jgi:hypothetical protein
MGLVTRRERRLNPLGQVGPLGGRHRRPFPCGGLGGLFDGRSLGEELEQV